MVNEFKGSRLKDARIFRALTLAEVASLTGLTKQAISQYENGTVKPEFSNVLRLADALKVPEEYFFTDSEKNTREEATYFRSLMTSNKKYRLAESKKMEFISLIFSVLEEYVEFPEPNYPLIEELEKIENLNYFNELDFFENLAQKVRDYWNIPKGPINDLKYILEANGIIVISTTPKSDTIDAYSQKVIINNKERLMIAVTNNQSLVRARFDMAHELGHCIMHTWTEDLETIDRNDFKEREKQANMFASALLLPKKEFLQDVMNHPVKLDYYLYLKKKWNVSIQAIIYRANSLGVFSGNQYSYLMRQISKKGFRKNEPFDIKYVIKDSLINISIEKLLESSYLSVNDLLHEFASRGVVLFSDEIADILNLEQSIFNINDSKKLINLMRFS